MKNQKKIAYGILLPAAALALLAAGMSLQESQARYVTVAGWHTQVYEPADAVTSSLLAKGGHQVLMGAIKPDSSYQLPVWVAAEGGNITGKLVCEPLENGEYITADFPENLTLVQGVPQNFTLTLQPTELAQNLQTEKVRIVLRLYWAEDPALEATLQLEIDPALQEESEDVQPGGVMRDLGNYVKIMEDYAPGSLLGMTCDIPQDCTSWRLGMLSGTSMDMPFPAGTRYSLDDGQNYWMLPKDGWIDLPVDTGAPVRLWLDFSRVDVDKTVFGGILSITVSAASDGQWNGKNIFSVNANLELPGNSEDTAVALVTREKPLTLMIPSKWDRTRLEYTLTRQGKQSDAPMPVVTVKEGKILVSAEDGLPKPGTYLLTLRWWIDELQIASRQIVLFVNYSVYAEPVHIPQETIPQETVPQETLEETIPGETKEETIPNETLEETIPDQTVSEQTEPKMTEGGETV
jgi:hypothetical protein